MGKEYGWGGVMEGGFDILFIEGMSYVKLFLAEFIGIREVGWYVCMNCVLCFVIFVIFVIFKSPTFLTF